MEKATSFGSVAELYDRRRPPYPAALFDDLLAVVPGARRALEAGSGTGRATVELALRGLEVVGVEPDAEMAAVAARRDPGPGGRDSPPGASRTGTGPPASFDMGQCPVAEAWHWVELRGRDGGRAPRACARRPAGGVSEEPDRAMGGRDARGARRRLPPPRAGAGFGATSTRRRRSPPGAALDGFAPLEVPYVPRLDPASYDADSFVEYLQGRTPTTFCSTRRDATPSARRSRRRWRARRPAATSGLSLPHVPGVGAARGWDRRGRVGQLTSEHGLRPDPLWAPRWRAASRCSRPWPSCSPWRSPGVPPRCGDRRARRGGGVRRARRGARPRRPGRAHLGRPPAAGRRGGVALLRARVAAQGRAPPRRAALSFVVVGGVRRGARGAGGPRPPSGRGRRTGYQPAIPRSWWHGSRRW